MYQVPGLKAIFHSQGEDISLLQVQGCPNELTERTIFKHEGNLWQMKSQATMKYIHWEYKILVVHHLLTLIIIKRETIKIVKLRLQLLRKVPWTALWPPGKPRECFLLLKWTPCSCPNYDIRVFFSPSFMECPLVARALRRVAWEWQGSSNLSDPKIWL